MPRFYILVENQRGPKQRHDSLEAATIEAKRLAALPTTHDQVFVLSVLAAVPCQTEFPREVNALPIAPPSKSKVKVTFKKPKRAMGAAL